MAQALLRFGDSPHDCTFMATTGKTPPPPTCVASESSVFAAFGAVLGYVGAEAATARSFERLLWPHRFFSNFTLASVPMLAFLMPMGGPMHKAALKTLDVMFNHGLLKGPRQGHMLDTAFFPQLNWSYTMHGASGHEPHTEPLRNCLWARVLSYMPIPILDPGPNKASGENVEKGTAAAAPPLRAQVVVSHLVLSRATARDKASDLPFVSEGTKTPNIRVFLAILTSEMSAILTAAGVFAVHKSSWAIIWLAPLFLRLISTLFALDREQLISMSSATAEDLPCDFEVHCPQAEGNFMLITGPPAVVLQFVRHYGHPVRNRFREVLQLAIVVAFGCLFPLGLLCSAVWMPAPVQYVWLCYQLYVVLAMHFVRYSSLGRRTTTEAAIAEQLSREASAASWRANESQFGSATTNGRTILFGHNRDGPETIKASVTATYHNRYLEGKECMEGLLRRREKRDES